MSLPKGCTLLLIFAGRGSVVHRSLDAGWIYGGNPARPIRERWPGGVPEG